MNRPGPDPSDTFRAAAPADEFEADLAQRLGRHAEHGVRPIDAAAIAHDAASPAVRTSGGIGAALGRLGWLLAGAVLAAGAIGGASWAGSHGLLGAAVSTAAPSELAIVPTVAPEASVTEPTTGATSVPTSACKLADLSARITSWDGAAGNRIAHVTMTNTGSRPCTIPSAEQPRLIDGKGDVLIDGDPATGTHAVVIPAGGTVSTQVDDANYCGGQPKAPVTVGFVFPGEADSGTSGLLEATPRSPTDTFGVPACLGRGGPAMITMHPWAP